MTIPYKTWDIDLEKMTCRNRNNGFEVTFEHTTNGRLNSKLTAYSEGFPALIASADVNLDNIIYGLLKIVRYIFAKEYFRGKYNPYPYSALLSQLHGPELE
jgi:hypothetical protein